VTKRSSGGRYGSGVDEDEWQRAKQLVLIKARRYQLDTVEVSDRLLIGMDDEQRKRLQDEVAAEGFRVIFKDHAGYGVELSRLTRSGPERFGTPAPKSHVRDRDPKGVDWANG
jgi:hypothetical protein